MSETATKTDLTNCDREPIQIPGAVQGHGILFVLAPETNVIHQISSNAQDATGAPTHSILGNTIEETLGPKVAQAIEAFKQLPQPEHIPLVICEFHSEHNNTTYDCLAHHHQELLIIELEKTEPGPTIHNPLALLKLAVKEAEKAQSLKAFCNTTVNYIKLFAGYDRVMVYQFAEDGSGEIIAEAKEDHLEPFIGMHYPATDIPEPARRLMLKNAIRVIGNVSAASVPLEPLLNPKTNKPLDMSHCSLRAVSPIHIEYLQNMGVGATMTISIIVEEQLVGLIACHHYSPLYLSHTTRNHCEFLSHAFALQYRNFVNSENIAKRIQAESISSQIIEAMQSKRSVKMGLMAKQDELLKLADADGLVFQVDDKKPIVNGMVPSPQAINELLQWLKHENKRLCATDEIRAVFPGWALLDEPLAGMLSIPLDADWNTYCLWFRQEISQTITWAGKPQKPQRTVNGELVLSPRSSFEKWEQKVEGTSSAWEQTLIQNAQTFAELHLKLHIEKEAKEKAQKALKASSKRLAESNSELQNFAYVASHDLQEPLRAIAGCLQILEKRYHDKLDENAKKLVGFAVDGSLRMRTLIEDLLEYSRLETKQKAPVLIDGEKMIKKVLANLDALIKESQPLISWKEPLPQIKIDETQCLQLFQNLIANAIKFRSEARPEIIISTQKEKNFWHFSIEDNGIGIKEEYYKKIFVIFQRLHGREEFPGNGIGLSMCKKIVEKHHGKIWIEKANTLSGTAFHFTLPNK